MGGSMQMSRLMVVLLAMEITKTRRMRANRSQGKWLPLNNYKRAKSAYRETVPHSTVLQVAQKSRNKTGKCLVASQCNALTDQGLWF